MAVHPNVEACVDEVFGAHGWHLAAEAYQYFCGDVTRQAQKNHVRKQSELRCLIVNMYHDHPTVQAALDDTHPNHGLVWNTIYDQIQRWLNAHRYYPQDAVMLNEFSPDICALEVLRQSLPHFYYGCRLSSYVYRVTECATKEWLRSHAALKRGGSGVTSALQRRMCPATPRWKMYYLSQSFPNGDGTCWEDMLPSEQSGLDQEIESRCLVQLIEATIQSMSTDADYAIIHDVWREMLLESRSVTALARRHAVPVPMMFNLRRRLVRRIRPVISLWRADEDQAE